MKKIALLPAIMLLFVFSCKREHSASIGPAGKKYPVTFNIANFKTSQSNFAVKHGANNLADTVSAASSGIDVLYYSAYSSGAAVHGRITEQDSSMANFGMITDSLPAGSYQIVFVAGKKGLQDQNDRTATDVFNYGSTQWLDTFWQEITITVGTGGVSEDVTLQRVVGKLELDITDAIPANADSLEININPEATNKVNDGGYPFGPPGGVVNYNEKIPASAIGTTNFLMDRIIGNTVTAFTVIITCTDASHAIIGSATINNVTVKNNMKTILSGKLFSSSAPANSQSFDIKIDTAWSSTVNQAGFDVSKNKPLTLQKTHF